MTKNLHGLSVINIELTSKCNKACSMCGRRKIEKNYPDLASYNENIDFELLKKISEQLPQNIIVQLHWNGEPLVYSYLEKALKLFSKQIVCFNTNGKLLLKKIEEIVGNADTLTISIIENDPEWKEQYEILKQFLRQKGQHKPNIILRCLGEIEEERMKLYKELNCIIAKRILHSPMGSFNYKKEPTIPEHGICLDFLTHLAINVKGEVSMCVRFDPTRVGVIGDMNNQTLSEIWNGEKRMQYMEHHVKGERNKIELCGKCEFWGIPRG